MAKGNMISSPAMKSSSMRGGNPPPAKRRTGNVPNVSSKTKGAPGPKTAKRM